MGIEKIRTVVVDDAEGIAADLDARMQKSVGAYRDPWLDGREPVTEGQFRTSLPLLPLPQVVCPLHGRAYDLNTGMETTGEQPICAYQAHVGDDGSIRVTIA